MPYEQASLIELIRTDNKILNKIVLVFTALCSEIDYLVKEGENKYFISLIYYGEASPASSETGETQKQLGKFLSLLQVNNFKSEKSWIHFHSNNEIGTIMLCETMQASD